MTNGHDFDIPVKFSCDFINFSETELPKGYQSTASVELKFYKNDREFKPDRIFWSIESIRNMTRAWNREQGALNGLAWGEAEVDGGVDWDLTPVIGGTSVTNSDGKIKLTDVVGERIVNLRAETAIDGFHFTDTIAVSFGKGPLSVFAKPPSK
ncbi:MAG: hypothetical protein LBS44_05400 [Deltaproteobacteria bacterium]|nr:hypothetical protein [Deltaproteobacteria bacterium]